MKLSSPWKSKQNYHQHQGIGKRKRKVNIISQSQKIKKIKTEEKCVFYSIEACEKKLTTPVENCTLKSI